MLASFASARGFCPVKSAVPQGQDRKKGLQARTTYRPNRGRESIKNNKKKRRDTRGRTHASVRFVIHKYRKYGSRLRSFGPVRVHIWPCRGVNAVGVGEAVKRVQQSWKLPCAIFEDITHLKSQVKNTTVYVTCDVEI
jgi:hypothetical protein